jgi:hypothetical protein
VQICSRIGFVITHPFQYRFFEPIAQQLGRCTFIIERRDGTPFNFSQEFRESLPGIVIEVKSKELIRLDGLLDVIFCMTPIHIMALFQQTKTICIQYSMAKEIYQYGAWRCLADLNVMQGEYSYEKVKGFCVADIGGNPRYDNLKELKRGGGGLLYVPTYGELSSLSVFERAIPSIPEKISIKIKLHHMSEFADAEIVTRIKKIDRIQFVDTYTDALPEIAAADVILSDYSGATFDAIAVGRPIALVQLPIEQTVQRTDFRSLEISRADSIGPVARRAEDISTAISEVLDKAEEWEISHKKLRAEIYAHEGESAIRIAKMVDDLLMGKYEPTLAQTNLRSTQTRYIKTNRTLRAQVSQLKALKEKPKVKKAKPAKRPRPLWRRIAGRIKSGMGL